MPKTHTATLKVIQGGRVTIPLNVRQVEKIKIGDMIEITIRKIATTEEP